MTRDDGQRVADILGAAEELAEIVAAGQSQFESDTVAQRAAERLIDIIGTAAGALSSGLTEANPDLEVGKAKSMRNLLSHEYWRSDEAILWLTIKCSVPEFVRKLRSITPP